MTIRFEVSPPKGATHEVELSGPLAVLGRDPSCDLVLNDGKCSRRHAVVEDLPEGLVIRDTGSANGMYVNGRRLERSRLRPGDKVRLGGVTLRVLAGAAETIVVAPDDLVASDVAAPAEPPARRPEPSAPVEREPPEPPRAPSPPRRPSSPRLPVLRARPERPLTVTVLSLLWAVGTLAWAGGGILVAVRADLGRVGGLLAVGGGFVAATASGLVAAGLWAQAQWARRLQIAAAVLGLAVCPFAFASATVLLYMLRGDVRAGFEPDPAPAGHPGAGPAETTFALSLLGMLALGLALTLWAAAAFTAPATSPPAPLPLR